MNQLKQLKPMADPKNRPEYTPVAVAAYYPSFMVFLATFSYESMCFYSFAKETTSFRALKVSSVFDPRIDPCINFYIIDFLTTRLIPNTRISKIG